MEKKNKISFVEELIFAICMLKAKFEFSRLFNSFLLFLINTQPLFFIFQLQQFEEYKNIYLYQFLELLLRPILTISRQFANNLEYSFLISFLLIIAHKIIFLMFFYFYQHEKNFIKKSENSFLKKTFCQAINLYFLLTSSYLFLDMNYNILMSLKVQTSGQLENQGFLIFLSIISLILIYFDNLISVVLHETIITNKIFGIEKTNQTFYKFVYQIFIISQILLILFVQQQQIEYFISALCLLQQIIIIIEIYFYQSYVMFYQIFPILISVSINLSFHLAVIFISLNNLQQFLIFIIIQFSIILTILLNYNQSKEKHILLSLFKTNNQQLDDRRIGLMKILNNEQYFKQEDLIYKVLIGRQHSQLCQKKRCQFCSHLSIMFNEQSGGITTQMHKEFIQFQNSQLIDQLDNNNVNEKIIKKSILLYAFFLFDFGQLIRSIKLLDNILTNNIHHHHQHSPIKQEQNSQCQSEFYSDGASMANKEYAFQIYDSQVVSQKFNLNYFENLQVKFILKCGKLMIGSSLFGTSLYATQQSMIQEFTEDHLKSEVQLKYFEEKILYFAERKQKFYKNSKDGYLLQTGQFSFNREVLTLCYEIFNIYKQIKIAYKQRPSKRFHSIFCFFIGEILCNYNKAIAFYKNSKFLDAELIKFQKITNFNVNQKNVQYIILELRDDMQNLKINTYSQGFFEKFGFKTEKERVFEDLIPDFLGHYHNLFVKQLFETGQSKYYNIFNVNFITNPYHLITAVNMCHTVTNLFSQHNMTFSVFLQEASQDQAFLLIDGRSMNCLFTKNLLLLIGWMESEIETLSSLKKLSNIEISHIFPSFQKIIRTKKSKDLNKINSVVLYFPTPQTSFEFLLTEQTLQTDKGRKSLKFTSVECDIVINKRLIGTYVYYILDVIKITQQQFARESISQKKMSINQTQYYQSIEPKEFEDCIFKEEDESPNIAGLNSVNFFQHNLIGTIKNISIIDPKNQVRFSVQDSPNIPILNSRREETQNQSEIQLLTQRNSQMKQDNQIQSFAKSKSSQKEKNKHKNNGLQNSDEDQINQNDKIHKHYDLVQQLLQLSPRKIQIKFIALFTFWFSIFLAFVITQFIVLNDDLSNFLGSIQLVSFYSAIMAPHDLFFSMRVTITAYQQMNREGFIQNEFLPQLTEPYYQNISLGYFELRENLYQQLSNTYLQPFLDEINVTMQFMNQNSSEIYPIETSFRDALFIVLQYQFAQMMTFYYRESTSGKPFQISLFANYFNFHEECFKLTQSMHDYIINQNSTVQNKWYLIWTIFSLSLFISYCYIQISQIMFFSQLSEFYKLIMSITEEESLRESQRYNELAQALKNSFHSIENYNPEFQLQINLKKIYSKRKNHLGQKLNTNEVKLINQNSKIKLINIIALIFLLIFMMLFSLLSMISASQFLLKFDATTNLYEQILDMKFRPGSLYLYREIFFRWSNFTFLTNENKNQLYNLIDRAFISIDNYIQISSTIDFDSYLVDSDFINMFQNINMEEFCSKIDDKFYKLSTQYCNLSFEGSINKGMIQTLNYIQNKVKAEQAINNFTQRVEYQLYEQEGSQIVSRIFFVLVNQFNQSLENQSNNLLNYFKILSIIYIVLIIVIQILIFNYYSPFLGNLIKILKQTVYLIPFESLMMNEHLERKLKELKFRFYG